MHLDMPTPDGTGSSTHPSVLDFGAARWRGHRFWMAHTPLYNNNEDLENPCILVSANGYHWTTPAGLTNPIDPWPGEASTYNSDTELAHDPVTDELVCMWREVRESAPAHERLYVSRSANGIAWSEPVLAIENPATPINKMASPALVRLADGSWRMYYCDHSNGTTEPDFRYREAAAPEGPYGAQFTVGGTMNPHHVAVIRHGGRYWAIGHHMDGIRIGSSVDGLSFTHSLILTPRAATYWDGGFLYRAALTVDPADPDWMHVWYASRGGTGYSWRIGFTRIPLSEWPTP